MTHETSAADPALPRQVLASLRPQFYSKQSSKRIHDPLVEPLWTGIRALAAVDGSGARVIDQEGEDVEGMDPILAGLVDASIADGLVLDGYLTVQTADMEPANPWPADSVPILAQFLGLRRKRRMDTETLTLEALQPQVFDWDDDVTFVATDLLWLDGETLFDVPLLERRRVLESVLIESDVVRVGAFIRPPISSWVASWRAQGFSGLSFKSANSRYTPGRVNPEWAISGMPLR
jgi:bifunctional non-homologous end joining protein LigD